MTIPVVTAVSDPGWEAALVAGLRGDSGCEVVRRCVDLPDLLAAGAAGLARAALLSADLRRLDRESVAGLAAAGVAAVGLVRPGDEAAERRLRQLGVDIVLPLDASSAEVADAVRQAVDSSPPAVSRAPVDQVPAGPDCAPGGGGRVVAVWGPAGAPGRSTVATTLAAECAAYRSVLLIDADVYGGVVAQLLGVLDESPGIAAACRAANQGTLDVAGLADLAVQVGPGLRLLTGIVRADRWPELRPSAVEAVLAQARRLVELTVVDCGFCLEQDEELSYDTAAPRRNGATLAVLAAADIVVGVAAADPVGLQRYIRGVAELRDAAPGNRELVTVVNRVRPGATGPNDPRREIAVALDRYAGISDPHFVPEDRAGVDRAVAAGKSLTEAAPRSPARLALAGLAAALAGAPVDGAKRARRARWRRDLHPLQS